MLKSIREVIKNRFLLFHKRKKLWLFRAQIHIPHSVPHFQHERRRNGKFVNAHSQECFRQRSIRRQFAADADPRAVGVSVLGTHLDEPQNRLMVGVDKRFNVRILRTK